MVDCVLWHINPFYVIQFQILFIFIDIHSVAEISKGTEQQQIFKWFLLEKICMYVYKISQNILGTYIYLLYVKFSKFFYSKLIVN